MVINMIKNNKILYTTIVLSAICAGVALLLAAVNMITAPIIKARDDSEKELAIKQLIPDLESFEIFTSEITDADELYIVQSENEKNYCVLVSPSGFGGDIEMIVAISADLRVKGVKVLSHTETAGVGTRITDDSFLSSFIGSNSSDGIDVLSGATVSSTAVKKGVSVALDAATAYQK